MVGSRIPMASLPPPRPLKRARTLIADSEPQEQRLDHIFITDDILTKKPGKKTPLSCCECRRLKLKCDRTFPCTSCKKRGCAEICPDGVLVSGKGTRFILANTEQLHGKIQEMSDRIRHLEEGLQAIHTEHAANPNQAHPLMKPELLGIKSTMGLYSSQATYTSEVPHAPPRPYPGTAFQSNQQPHERSSSEDTVMVPEHPPPPVQSFKDEPSEAHFRAEIAHLSHTFPLTDSTSFKPNIPLRRYIASHLPPREEADYLWEQARQNALWQYNPHPSSTFYPNLAYHCYTTVSSPCPRRLALLYMILAVGCLVDLQNRAPDHPDAEKYHQLARACLCEVPVMEDTNVETITALFYEIWYLLVFSDKKKAAGYAWGLMGLTAKLAQSIGLHRNGGKSKVIPEEVEKRRSLFWELLYLDARLSLSLGRPPSLSLSHVDCPRPSYTPDEGCDLSESLHYYQEWKHSCYHHCLAPVLDAISQPSLNYDTVMDLDKRIRDFSIPTPLRVEGAQSRSIIMQKASLSTALEAVLLQLHRQFFTRALSGPDERLNRRHKYAPSVVAVVLSASRMIATVQDLYHQEPHLTARILGYWSNAFSAALALCLLVSRAPFTCLAPAALQELERARILFRSAKDFCPRAMQVVPILETMIDKANVIYDRWSAGHEMPTVVLKRNASDDECESTNGGGTKTHVDHYGTGQHGGIQQESDPFARFHPRLVQCIVEVHQRAKSLVLTCKACQSAPPGSNACPLHSWGPTPVIQSPCSPVLPPEVPHYTRISSGPPYSSSRNDLDHGNGMPSSSSLSSPTQSYSASSSAMEIHASYGMQQQHQQLGPAPSPDVFYSNSNVLPSTTVPWPPSTLTALSPTSKMAIVDTINFELGALNSNGDQSWMAFF